MEKNGDKVIEAMLNNTQKPVLFYKHMIHHLLDLNREFTEIMTSSNTRRSESSRNAGIVYSETNSCFLRLSVFAGDRIVSIKIND